MRRLTAAVSASLLLVACSNPDKGGSSGTNNVGNDAPPEVGGEIHDDNGNARWVWADTPDGAVVCLWYKDGYGGGLDCRWPDRRPS